MSFKSLIKRQGNQVIYKSPYVKQIDFKPATLVEIALTFPSYKLPQSWELYIDAKDPNHILTFGSNLQGIVAIANYLQLKYQLQPGDVVCLFLKMTSIYLRPILPFLQMVQSSPPQTTCTCQRNWTTSLTRHAPKSSLLHLNSSILSMVQLNWEMMARNLQSSMCSFERFGPGSLSVL